MTPRFNIDDKVEYTNIGGTFSFVIDNYCVFRGGRILYYKDLDSKGIEESILTLCKEPKTEIRYKYIVKMADGHENKSNRPFIEDYLYLDDDDFRDDNHISDIAWFRKLQPGYEVPV
jgi:hypothetical protein